MIIHGANAVHLPVVLCVGGVTKTPLQMFACQVFTDLEIHTINLELLHRPLLVSHVLCYSQQVTLIVKQLLP